MSLRWLRLTVFQYPLFNVPVFRDIEALHEVSGVKVPSPASPFITHETSMLLEGMAVAVSRGKCMDELVYISTWYVVEWCSRLDHNVTTVLTVLKEIDTLQRSVGNGWWIFPKNVCWPFFCWLYKYKHFVWTDVKSFFASLLVCKQTHLRVNQ